MTEITVEHDDGAGWVTIDHPGRKNSLTGEACVEFADALVALANDESVRCVVVTGANDAFCSGIDLAGGAGTDGAGDELEKGLNVIARQLLTMEKPTVASVTGPAVGAGAAIATACDFVYASESATFGWGFTDIGLAPDTGATYVLTRLVGYRTAMELLTTGRRLSATEAADLDLVNSIVPDDSLASTVEDHVRTLCNRPTKAVGELKRLLVRNSHRSIEEALASETRVQKRMLQTDDFIEGVSAFLEDRQPEFTGN